MLPSASRPPLLPLAPCAVRLSLDAQMVPASPTDRNVPLNVAPPTVWASRPDPTLLVEETGSSLRNQRRKLFKELHCLREASLSLFVNLLCL